MARTGVRLASYDKAPFEQAKNSLITENYLSTKTMRPRLRHRPAREPFRRGLVATFRRSCSWREVSGKDWADSADW